MRLRQLVEDVQRHPAAPSWFAGAIGFFVGLAIAAVIVGAEGAGRSPQANDAGDPPQLMPLTPPDPDDQTQLQPTISRDDVRRALEAGIASAEELGGDARAAVWVQGWDEPVVLGSEDSMRMWSMSKPVVSLAALMEGARAGGASDALRSAIELAITQSDNCAIRRVTLDLQELTGGVDGARDAFNGVLDAAGITIAPVEQVATAEPICHEYLQQTGQDLSDPLGPAVRFGTAEWTLRDAIGFAHALADGTYSDAGAEILRWMAAPKARDENIAPEEFTADVNFGAGNVFETVSYKAGWGGHDQGGPYLVGQIGVLTHETPPVAFAATFHPVEQPATDDPGSTPGPKALETIFRALQRALP